MTSICKVNQDVFENQFSNVRLDCFAHGSTTERESMDSMVKSIFIRMENIQKSDFGIMKETDYNKTQTMNCKRSSSVRGKTSWKKQRAAHCLGKSKSLIYIF